MLRFFRLIRRKLLEEEHISKYIWYALGEILLVMIGILLALQVNNWNEDRKLKMEELSTVELLIRDLKTEREKMFFFYDDLLEQEKGIHRFLEVIDQEQPEDSVLKYAFFVLDSYLYRPAYPIYESLKSDNSLKLIRSQEVKDTLFIYHEESIPYLKDLTERYLYSKSQTENILFKYLGYESDISTWRLNSLKNVEQLKSNVEAIHWISKSGRDRAWLISRMDGIFFPDNERLTNLLINYLAELRE